MKITSPLQSCLLRQSVAVEREKNTEKGQASGLMLFICCDILHMVIITEGP